MDSNSKIPNYINMKVQYRVQKIDKLDFLYRCGEVILESLDTAPANGPIAPVSNDKREMEHG
jgi:hypothetical protein